MVRIEVRTLLSFGQFAEYEAKRSLDLIRAIDDTIYACARSKEALDGLSSASRALLQPLQRVEGPIDADGVICGKLEKARESLADFYQNRTRKRESAASDPRLHEDDGVVEGFDYLLDSIANAHNALNELCWAIGEHDADFDTVLEGEFTSADDLFRAMGV